MGTNVPCWASKQGGASACMCPVSSQGCHQLSASFPAWDCVGPAFTVLTPYGLKALLCAALGMH